MNWPLSRNWELKLVSLVIAIALWIYTNGQVRVDRTLTVVADDPTAVQSLPKNYRVISILPHEFTIKINLPENQIRTLKTEALVPKLVIGAEALASGVQIFPVTNRTLGLEDDIRIEHVDSDFKEIRVTFAAIAEDYLPVEVPRLVGVPEGLESTVGLDRTRVRVRGTREQLDRLKTQGEKVTFDAIDVADIDPTIAQAREETLKLTAAHTHDYDVIEPVTATVSLRPVTSSRQVVSLPVLVLAPRDFLSRYQIELNQPQVSLTIHGPENLLKTLRSELDLTAYINLRRALEPNVAHEIAVNLVAPSWLTCDPASVRVVISLPIKAVDPTINNK